VEQLAAAGQRVGLLSADMGQASVGVPACLGLALAPAWREPATSWFIGDTTPMGNLLPTVVGTARLADRARRAGVQTLLIDPTGLVEGQLGCLLKYHKVVATGVDHLIAIQQADELEPLLGMLAGLCRTIHRLTPVVEAYNRTLSDRKQYRQERFQAYLRGGVVHRFRPDLLVGRDWVPDPLARGQLPALGSVAGLLDREGFCLGIGVIEEVRAEGAAVFTPWPDPGAVVRVQVGTLRLDRQGEELA
jgi:polynucleotide 5'-kinase involved in rRNA processing